LQRPDLGARCVAGRGSLGRGVIHKILQFLAGLEERNLLRWYFDLFAGLRIAPNAPASVPGAETAKAADLDLFAFLQAAIMLSKIVSTMVSDSFEGVP